MRIDHPDLRPLWIAGRFLTRYPFPDPGPIAPAELGQAVPWYPAIGLVLGLVVGLAAVLLGPAMFNGQPGVAAALVLGLWVWSTGGLHLDGLADTADAWVGGLGSRDRTLAIMKDPTSGPAGVSALVLVLIAKFAGLQALITAGDASLLLWVPLLARVAVAPAPAEYAVCPASGNGRRPGAPRTSWGLPSGYRGGLGGDTPGTWLDWVPAPAGSDGSLLGDPASPDQAFGWIHRGHGGGLGRTDRSPALAPACALTVLKADC